MGTRARILLKTDQGWTASQVACSALDISERTVFRAFSGGTPRRGWMRCCGTATKSAATGPLDDRGIRPSTDSLGLHARLREWATTTGRCAHAGGQSGGAGTGPVPVPRDGAAAAEKNASQASGGNSNGAFPKVTQWSPVAAMDGLDAGSSTSNPVEVPKGLVVCFERDVQRQLLADGQRTPAGEPARIARDVRTTSISVQAPVTCFSAASPGRDGATWP